jgi:spore maturation protein CgeB
VQHGPVCDTIAILPEVRNCYRRREHVRIIAKLTHAVPDVPDGSARSRFRKKLRPEVNLLIYDCGVADSGVRYPLRDAAIAEGHSAEMFDWSLFVPKGLGSTITRKLLSAYTAGRINNEFRRAVDRRRYDALLVLTGRHLRPETLAYAKERIPVIANWNTDDLFNLLNSSRHTIASIPLYDVHFTPRRHLVGEYRIAGAKAVLPLHWYYRPGLIARPSEPYSRSFHFPLTFVGSWSRRRNEVLEPLAAHGLVVYGWGWTRKARGTLRSMAHSHVGIQHMMGIFRRSGINVNILTVENRDTSNMRNFEIPAAKGFQLCERSAVVQELFEEDREIVLFESTEELVDKVRYYLRCNSAREAIALAGYERIVRGGHSLADRMREVLHVLEDYRRR